MQNNLVKQKCFVRFILETEKQFVAIFRTLNPDQANVLAEIIHNVLQGILELTEDQLKVLRRHRKLLRKIPTNKSLLVKNAKTLYHIFKVLRNTLRDVLPQ